jgi:hypothetical protein
MRWPRSSPLLIACMFFVLGSCSALDDPQEASIDASGTYVAQVSPRDFTGVPGPTTQGFGGKWTLTLDQSESSYRIEGDALSRVSGFFDLDGGSAIFDDDPAPAGAFNCYINDARTLTEGRATYEAQLADGVLELSVEDEPCPLRGAILERRWEEIFD